jgi:hypothetical protein
MTKNICPRPLTLLIGVVVACWLVVDLAHGFAIPEGLPDFRSFPTQSFRYDDGTCDILFFDPKPQRHNNPYMKFYRLVTICEDSKPVYLFEYKYGNVKGWSYKETNLPVPLESRAANAVDEKLSERKRIEAPLPGVVLPR